MKAILIGNGMTSNLISDYSNKVMMSRISDELGELLDKINNIFSLFRCKVEDVESFSTGYGYTGMLECGLLSLFQPMTGIRYNDAIKEHCIDALIKLGLKKSEELYSLYFEKYGLVYETQNERVSNVENILKVISLFMSGGLFNQEEYLQVKLVASRVYFNQGKNKIEDTKGLNISKSKVFFNEYDFVFTTNYDLVLDTLLPKKDIYHIHGGFNYKNKSTKVDYNLDPMKAYLVWGSSSEEKKSQITPGIDFNNFDFGDIDFGGDSLLEYYLQYIEDKPIDEIHLFGYSGENDDHINRAFKNNSNISRIVYYANPEIMNNEGFRFKVRSGLNLEDSDNRLHFESWDKIWNKIRV